MQFVLIVGENNLPIFNEIGEVLVHDVTNGNGFFVESSDYILNTLPRTSGSLDISNCTGDTTKDLDLEHIDPSLDQDLDKTGTSKAKAYWDYEMTIVLINKYKAHYPLFADDIHKNTEVWDMIAAEFRDEGYSFNSTQCENRWKYIRGKYIKKKDNDSDSNTGGAYFDFEYFNEIDEILGKKPNVVPKYLASSSEMSSSSCSNPSKRRNLSARRRQSSPLHLDSSNVSAFFSDANVSLSEEEEEIRRSVSNSPAAIKSKSKKEQSEDNVQRQERFHNEMMQAQRDSMDVFKDVMLKVVEAFNKK